MSTLIKRTFATMVAALLLGFASQSFAGFAAGSGDDGSVAAGSSYDAVLSGVGNGGGIQGALRGQTQNEGFAGTIVIDLYKDGTKVSTIGSFCTNITHNTYIGEKYNMSSEMADCKVAYVVSKYPPLLSFAGLSKGQANTEAMARQAAVWYFADGYVTTGPADVKARTDAIIADADTNANCASLDKPMVLSVSPANQAVIAGVPASYTVTATRNGQPVAALAVELTTDVGTLSGATVTTDNMGQATFTVSSDTAVTANVTAIARYAMPAGTVLLGLNGERQKLVLADSKYAAAGSVADIGIASAVANTVFQPSSGGLTVNVFHDRNITGTKDADNEENLSGIKVTVYDSKNKSKGTLTTDVNGLVNFAGLPNDTYKVVYTLPANTLDTNNPDNRMSKTATAKMVTVNDDSKSVDFGVVKMPFVKACVYEDVPSTANVPISATPPAAASSGKPVYYTPSLGQTVKYENGLAVVYNKNGDVIGKTNGMRDRDWFVINKDGVSVPVEKGLKGWLVKLHRKDGSSVLGAESVTGADGSAVVTFSRLSDFTVGGSDYYLEVIKTTGSQWNPKYQIDPVNVLEDHKIITLSASSYLDMCVSGATEVPLLGEGTRLTTTATDQGVALSWVSEGAITLWRAQKDAQGKWVGIESLNPGHTVDAAGLLVDSNVSSGQTYYYAVESVNDAGEDSLYILETPVTAK